MGPPYVGKSNMCLISKDKPKPNTLYDTPTTLYAFYSYFMYLEHNPELIVKNMKDVDINVFNDFMNMYVRTVKPYPLHDLNADINLKTTSNRITLVDTSGHEEGNHGDNLYEKKQNICSAGATTMLVFDYNNINQLPTYFQRAMDAKMSLKEFNSKMPIVMGFYINKLDELNMQGRGNLKHNTLLALEQLNATIDNSYRNYNIFFLDGAVGSLKTRESLTFNEFLSDELEYLKFYERVVMNSDINSTVEKSKLGPWNLFYLLVNSLYLSFLKVCQNDQND
ncbi:Uncharacterised protein [Candidatus Tiddalikarchaeum anstoanum]|nr:Uncharacterised protein [Candidatus Tiddalikarchaeum anstoanum]